MAFSLDCSAACESNGSCVTALRVGTLATGWKRGSRSLELEMDGRPSTCAWNLGGVTSSGDIRLSVFGRERPKRQSLFVQHRCPLTGGQRQVWANRLMDLRSMVERPRVLGPRELGSSNVSTRCRAFADGVSLFENGTCTCEVYTWTEDRQVSARRRATAGGDIHGLGTASRLGFARMVNQDTGTYRTCLPMFSLSLVAARRFVSRHIEAACERSNVQCMLEGHSCEVWLLSSCETLVHGCLWRIVMHAHQASRPRD